MSNNIEIIEEILREFHSADLNSNSTRNWIAIQIDKKLNNVEYEIQKTTSEESKPQGEFERKLMEQTKKEIDDYELRREETRLKIEKQDAVLKEKSKNKPIIKPNLKKEPQVSNKSKIKSGMLKNLNKKPVTGEPKTKGTR